MTWDTLTPNLNQSHDLQSSPVLLLLLHLLELAVAYTLSSLIPRLSPHAFSILQVTESRAGPGNEATLSSLLAARDRNKTH